MTGTCRLNNKSMRNIRRNEVYQCLAIDLAMLGVISKEECEMLIGGGIPNNLVLPNGETGELISEKGLPKEPKFIKTEPVVTSDTGTDDTEATESEQTSEIVTPDAVTITTDNGDISPIEGDETQDTEDDQAGTESDN